jgi:LemA protein
MKNLAIGCFAVVVLVVLIVGMAIFHNYNKMVTLNLECDRQWAQVENQLKRRYDLIPNMVNVVKGYAKHEKDIFTQIADARARMAGAGNVKDKIAASNQFEGAISRLMMISERYPDLKANEQFTGLRDELAGTENRIAVERGRYNDTVRDYNMLIVRIPGRFYASMFNFKERPFFEVAKEEQAAPKVNF